MGEVGKKGDREENGHYHQWLRIAVDVQAAGWVCTAPVWMCGWTQGEWVLGQDGPWTGIAMAGRISEAGWEAGGSGRSEVGRDEAGRASNSNAGRQERQWLEQGREMKW